MNYKDIQIAGSDTGGSLTVKCRIDIIMQYVKLEKKYILDCGCGSGEYVLELLKYSENTFGVEYSEDKVRNFKLKDIKPENVVQGDIENLQYENDSFDVVLLNEVLEHIPDQQKALNEIYRVLKKGGNLVVFSPNRFYPFETHAVEFKLLHMKLPIHFPFISYVPLSVGNIIFKYHARNYFPGELKNIISKSRFKVVKQDFVIQQFEGLGGHNNFFYKKTRTIFRFIFNIAGKVLFLRNFLSVSQVVFAVKPAELKK